MLVVMAVVMVEVVRVNGVLDTWDCTTPRSSLKTEQQLRQSEEGSGVEGKSHLHCIAEDLIVLSRRVMVISSWCYFRTL
ncbi:hypothetical protein E2C01_043188 [Portunus trituberculatus]|uniref:Secreted protein n=1 Tax=Portunus trituberculatus TaxID=210409 RepID=A0A5B7FVM9_PORTR|nr:hypothetical protein [Portunus trituberculatus]